MEKWYQSNLGTLVAKSEITGSEYLVSTVFGYFLLQMGGSYRLNYLPENLVHHHLHYGPEKPSIKPTNFIQGQYDELPFIHNSIDTILVSHILEFSLAPKQILEEIYEVLVPDGNLIIFCFNPYSLWGLTKIFSQSQTCPWPNHLLKPGQMRQLLIETGFSVGDYKTFFFRPPTQNIKLLKKLLFLEALGPIFWPYLGASYMFIAKKVVTNLTPITLIPNNNQKLKIAVEESWVKPTPTRNN
jgi:SAM-dependent methyltransferase